jgi:dUTP pyrophosphatase
MKTLPWDCHRCKPNKPGDRIAQAMLVQVPRVTFEVVEQLSLTERGAGGFGSTGGAA